ncbi:phosphoribosylanthranilate isomerase [Desulfofundulus australicus DSM 11792]|uniref:N-(5'-phosphoribosyl)anthranilate isomerase n=1 Tax=Desulfofundulus australicus DSM 11792 TaxID=1121425 RepID=A0A1M4W0H4_9FIRM|nr:phosphoribosylanthranilate isomerase [Desulfofundulus australicus]SHE74697.1 phosphoribosylanthranilate isomerase [Desulfofundulus australicus DSM 11792]
MVRIKICGITDISGALAAAEAGADALGFVFAPSPRCITPVEARLICRELPPFITRVGVFVDAPLEEVRAVADYCGLDVIQLHGNEPVDYCRAVGRRVIKAFRVGGELKIDPQAVSGYPADAILLDTFVAGRKGGTGQPFDWHLAAGLKLPRPLILAGGLTPENVGRAVELVRPYGVDVSSGVEMEGRPGKKDPEKIRRFIAAARASGWSPA